MWARPLRAVRSAPHRKARFSRSYQGQPQHTAHTTYFQPPPKPPRRLWRSVILGTTCLGLGAYAHSRFPILSLAGMDFMEQLGEDLDGSKMFAFMGAAGAETAAVNVPPMDLEMATDMLRMRSSYQVTSKAVSHTCQLPSNLPCEDVEHSGVYNYFGDVHKDWATWAIFDGHAGPRTSRVLRDYLPLVVLDNFIGNKVMDRSYTPNDHYIIQTIKSAFLLTDKEIIQKAADAARSSEGDLAGMVSVLAPALSGSCALMAVFDPVRSVLRIANVGDSRAVLGQWDAGAGKYVAKAMSHDQTGFNEEEMERLKRNHPDEDVVDPKTGRVHGIMVSRAFGDSRWKWPQELSQLVHDKFWGPSPRPNGMIKTPPYLTAEPEVMESKIIIGERADFLIMASDGLWDVMSSEDAVTCVEQWLAQYKPDKFLEDRPTATSIADMFRQRDEERKAPTYTPLADMTADEDTYFDEDEKVMKWRVSPKHFVVEDDNCGIHLIKNALGGKRRNLFCGVVSIQPPLSRKVRDDITVQVIFFGDFQQAIDN